MRCRCSTALWLAAVALLLAGCASSPTPIPLPLRDESVTSRARYAQDLQTCTEQTRMRIIAERPMTTSWRSAIFGRPEKGEQQKVDAYMQSCLQARGYELIPGDQEGSGAPARSFWRRIFGRR